MPDTKTQVRELLAEVYAETLGQEFSEGIAAYSLENMIQEELDRLEGPVNEKYRHAVIPYLQDLKVRFADQIEKIKELPPEDFVLGEGQGIASEETPAE
jgi:hypothetical protein